MTRLQIGLLLGCAVAVAAGVTAYAALDGGAEAQWGEKGPMPYERGEVALAEIDGKVYVLSGNSPGTEATGFAQEYDPVAGAWRELAFSPRVASHAGAAAVNGKVYMVGGFVATVHIGAVDRVFEYDPATDSWRAVAPLSAPRGSAGVVALNGKVHAIGGRTPQNEVVDTHEIYDPATDTWTLAAQLPVGRDHLGIAVLDGKIHVFGGRTGGQMDLIGNHDVYDPATDSWTSAAPLNVPRSAGVGFVVDGKIVYAGGECKVISETERRAFEEAEIYDPATDSWSDLPPMTPGRHASAAIVVNGEPFIVGGNAGCGGQMPQATVATLEFN